MKLNAVKLIRAECEYVNAMHFRDSQKSELTGAVAARRNGTDYYHDDDDFKTDINRRVDAWDYWEDKMKMLKAEIFKLCLLTGKESEYLDD